MADAHTHESFWDKVKNAFAGEPTDFDRDEDYYRSRHAASGGVARDAGSYDDARSAYRLGHTAGVHDDADRRFEDVEPELGRGWASQNPGGPPWSDVRGYAGDAYARGQERRIVLSEEQLNIGKRQVQAGEVGIRKTVETEHVRETVPLVREEVSIERHPVSADAAAARDLTIGEDEVRVPLMREEAVVEKRVVPTEEVVVRTNAVTEERVVEDDVRRERLVTDGLDDRGRVAADRAGVSDARAGFADREFADRGFANQEVGMSGAEDRATNTGPLDRAADKLDDLKDRVDGNPASRPGPDATDRRI